VKFYPFSMQRSWYLSQISLLYRVPILAITSTYYTHVQLYELLEPLCAVLHSTGMQNVVLKASKHRFYMCTCSGEAVWLVNKSFPYRVRLIFPLLHFTVSASNMQVLFYLFLLKEASLFIYLYNYCTTLKTEYNCTKQN